MFDRIYNALRIGKLKQIPRWLRQRRKDGGTDGAVIHVEEIRELMVLQKLVHPCSFSTDFKIVRTDGDLNQQIEDPKALPRFSSYLRAISLPKDTRVEKLLM